jgi:glycosyltransferase 2 family protein
VPESPSDTALPAPISPSDPPPEPSAPPGRPAAAGLGRLVSGSLRVLESRPFKLGFVLLMAALGGYAVVSQWKQVSANVTDLGAGAIVQALALVCGSWLASMLVWRLLLAASGSRVPLRGAAHIYFVGQLGKYVPGSVWPVLAQMELGRAYRVPRERSATSAVLAMAVNLTSALLVTLVAVPFLGGSAVSGYWWAFLCVPVLLAFLHPRVLNPVIGRVLRAARRTEPQTPLSGRAICAAVALNTAGWVLAGAQIWLLAVRLGAPVGRTFPVAVGAFAFAWAVGFLIVFAPAGAGVRELILVATLTPVLHSAGAATVVALASRLITVLADLLCAAVAAFVGRRGARPGTAGGPESADSPAGRTAA